MATITLTLPIAATGLTAGLHSTNYAAIQAAVNALDNSNFSVSANLDPLKIASGWAAYTPAWGSTGTPPVLNNGTLTGSYMQIGKTVFTRITLVMGTTTTYGTAAYLFNLPVTAATGFMPTGQWAVTDASPAASYLGLMLPGTGTTSVSLAVLSSPAGSLTNLSPITFATGDIIDMSFFYRAA